MSSAKKNTRLLFAVMGFAIAAPAALTLMASSASASGYMVASGFDNDIYCTLGGADECPEGGVIVQTSL